MKHCGAGVLMRQDRYPAAMKIGIFTKHATTTNIV